MTLLWPVWIGFYLTLSITNFLANIKFRQCVVHNFYVFYDHQSSFITGWHSETFMSRLPYLPLKFAGLLLKNVAAVWANHDILTLKRNNELDINTNKSKFHSWERWNQERIPTFSLFSFSAYARQQANWWERPFDFLRHQRNNPVDSIIWWGYQNIFQCCFTNLNKTNDRNIFNIWKLVHWYIINQNKLQTLRFIQHVM